MESKKINFHIFRYHLLPLNKDLSQIELFEPDYTYEQVLEMKNKFFSDALLALPTSKNNSNPLRLEHSADEHYLFKIANKKSNTVTQNFEKITIDDEPYSYVVINNDNRVQKIAISDNADAFTTPDVVKNILKKILKKDLEKYGLNIEIEALFSTSDFWEYLNTYKNKITYINFEFIKPNLAQISKSLPEDFRNFAESVNSHESHITIKAPENGVLENIDEKNSEVKGLVEYSSEGAGTIKLKIKGYRKTLSTNDAPSIIEINEADIEGPSEQVIKLYKTLVEE